MDAYTLTQIRALIQTIDGHLAVQWEQMTPTEQQAITQTLFQVYMATLAPEVQALIRTNEGIPDTAVN